MKRAFIICAVLLAAVLALTFSACSVGIADQHNETPAEPTAPPASAAPAEPTAAPEKSPEPEPSPEASPEPSVPPVETPPPEETPAAEESPDPTLMTFDELSGWIDEQEGDIGAILSGLQGIQLDLTHAPGEFGDTVDYLPEEFSFLFPDGLREGDFVTEATDGYNVSLFNRTPEEYDELIRLAEAAGYEGRRTDAGLGISIYEGYRGPYVLEMLYSAGTVEISHGIPAW